MPNEIDELMSRLGTPEGVASASAKDIDDVIIYYRKARASYDAGVKPKKGGSEATKIDLVQLGLLKAPEPIKRRI